MALRIETWEHAFPLREAFVLSRGARSVQRTLQVRLTDGAGASGRGEACGIPYAGDTPDTMAAEIAQAAAMIEQGVSRAELLNVMAPGGARHAVDAALWDLEAKAGGADPFAVAGLRPNPVVSACTIAIRDLAAYEAEAERLADFEDLKVKVSADNPVAAVRAVRRGAPRARLIVDPNQSWTIADVETHAGALADLGVVLLEQPIPVGAEAGLAGYRCPILLCADELVETAADLQNAQGRFDVVNIKLDKIGGLTAALDLANRAEAMGFQLMVGCMVGSSLSMAPAMVLAQRCAFVDLDGPLLQTEDLDHGFEYIGGRVASPHNKALWG